MKPLTLILMVSPRGATGDDWPLLGPALVAATFTAIGLAITWLPLRPKAFKTLVTWILLATPARWTAHRFVPGLTSMADDPAAVIDAGRQLAVGLSRA